MKCSNDVQVQLAFGDKPNKHEKIQEEEIDFNVKNANVHLEINDTTAAYLQRDGGIQNF